MATVVILAGGAVLSLWDPDDPCHAAAVARVRELRESRARFVVPAVVVAEVLVGAARQGEARLRMRLDQLRAAFGEPWAIDARTATAAARLQAAHADLRTTDALVIACAQVLGAEEILTADRRWEAVDPRVRVLG
jgi:predicted nucleic acid-binding protein